jgi:hypothetical protein
LGIGDVCKAEMEEEVEASETYFADGEFEDGAFRLNPLALAALTDATRGTLK